MKALGLDRLWVGLALIVGLFSIELAFPLNSVLFIVAVLYILRHTGSQKNVLRLGIATSVAVVALFLLRHSELNDLNSFIIHFLMLGTIWISVYANVRIRVSDADKKEKQEQLEEVRKSKEDSEKRLKVVLDELGQQADEKRQIEDELAKRKKLQEAMAHNFPDGVICVLNTEMKFILADGGEMEDLGLLKTSKINDTSPLNLRDLPELKRAFQGENISTELTINNKQYTVNGVPIPDGQSQISEVLLVIRNITDQRNLENNLIKALEREKELNALKSQFVTMASHKFRTPLSTILSSVFLLENYTDADYELEKTAFFDKIKRSVHNLTALLNDYLSLGKLEEGKLKVSYSETDMKVFFDEFLQEIGSIKKVKQKILFTHEGIECKMMTDKFLLKNILTNLLSNAIEYSPHDAEIQLHAELKKDALRIRVTDQGIGIPENEQHQIFKRFYRGQNASNVEGTGLGLNIAKKYIRLLKGTIEFTSQLNKGTTFVATIPVMNVNVLEKQA